MNKHYIILGGLLLFLVFLAYGLSDSGRLVRDHGTYSSGISDPEVKSIWCGNLGFEEPYKEINGKDFCGSQEVVMICIFSNGGDACSIQDVNVGNGVA